MAAAGALAATASQLVWASDGPNWPGLILMFLSAGLLVSALIHPWRRPRSFAWLATWSLVGIPVFAALHNVFYALGELSSETRILPLVFDFLHVAAFVVSLVLCPAAVVIGLVGWLIRSRLRP